jgi:glycosyltransferase involved in cell wall biosynthesis
MGNGAAIKSGARAATGEVLVFMDADGQHPPEAIPRLLQGLSEGFDMVVGARDRAGQASAGRSVANRFYNALASWMVDHRIADLTSGFRAVRANRFREFLHLLPNGFSTPTTTTLAFVKAGYNVAFVPIEARARVGSSKIRLLRDGAKFFLIVLKVVTLFSPLRVFLPISAASFVVGLSYAVWTIATQSHVTNSSVLLIMLGVVVFLMGLVSEQIAALRFEGRE